MFRKILKGYAVVNTLLWAVIGIGEYLSRNFDRNGFKDSWIDPAEAAKEIDAEAWGAIYGYAKECAECVKEFLGFY